ncbi:MAG: hypothetical protein AB7Q97_06120 [Gammaproteobacteria bacterium]
MATDASAVAPVLPAAIELDCTRLQAWACAPRYGVLRVGQDGAGLARGDRVLAPIGTTAGGGCGVDPPRCVRLPDALDARAALLLPPVAAAMGAWAALKLELGDVAVCSGAGPMAALAARIACWHGAMPVVVLDGDHEPPDRGEPLSSGDPLLAVARIQALSAGRAGFAALDLGGRADAAAVLLAALPRWGRLFLAAETQEPLTVDFYGDVHVKGALILTGALKPFDPPAADAPLCRRALRLLQRTDCAGPLLDLFGA